MSILDLPQREFMAMLPELAQQGVDTDALLRQYRSANSPLAGVNQAAQAAQAGIADEGRRGVAGGLLSKDVGATGMDALRSLRVEPMAGLLGMLSGAGQAVEAPSAAARGLIPVDDVALEALGTAGMAMAGGGAAVAPRGSLRMGLALNEKDMFHGTPDVRDLRKSGAFDQMTEGTQRISDLDAWRRLGDQIEAVGPTTPEGIDLMIARSKLLESQRVNRPVFATPDRPMAASYADDTRAFDYQRAEPAIVSMRSNPQRILDINAGGSDFRGIDLDRVRKGFRDAGIPDADIDDALSRYIVAPRSDGKLSTNDLSAVSQSLGFDAVDIANVRDAYNNNSRTTPGTVRMMFNSDQIQMGDMQMLANANTSGGLLATAASDALTPSQQMARRILDMRAAGRAGDVTDDMMAQADPQYMYNNTPLPMDAASRLARAGDARFDTDQRYYHGSAAEDQIDRFDMAYAGSASQQPDERAIFTTQNPDVASFFANYASPGAQRMPFGGAGEGQVLPVTSRGSVKGIDWMGQPYNGERMVRDLNYSSSNGFDRMAISGMRENLDGFDQIDKQTAVFNPRNIRSRFARFDPEFSHLSNLSAANASPATGLLGVSAVQEDKKELPFMNFMRGLLQ